jgi:hypothetical protein
VKKAKNLALPIKKEKLQNFNFLIVRQGTAILLICLIQIVILRLKMRNLKKSHNLIIFQLLLKFSSKKIYIRLKYYQNIFSFFIL